MYIIKNALRSISRSIGRNILIGIIALVIAISACIALSIRESASKAKEDTLSLMNITAQISVDRQSMMSGMKGEEDREFDRESMKELLQSGTELALEEYEKYAEAESVKDSYYSLSTSLNASGELEPVDSNGTFSSDESDSSEQSSSNMPNMPDMGGGKGFMGKMGAQGDFTVIGYSSDNAMTDFTDGNLSIEEGNVFDEGTSENNCIISQELATYNDLIVGDEIILTNPNDEDETFTLKIVGIYSGTASADTSFMGGFSTAGDSANRIMMSYTALKALSDASSESAEEVTDENSGMTSTTAISSSLSFTYVFNDVEAYEAFEAQARELGLDDSFTISSSDITAFEQSLTPLENLSKTASYFLIVVFAIGAVILVVLNIFNIRERKYEIGVLTAIGMKKGKVAIQFVTELFVVTLAAIILGAGIGAVTSVPVTNALLEAQISSNKQANEAVQESFGRDTGAGRGGMMQMPGEASGDTEKPEDVPDMGSFGNMMQGFMSNANDYISEVSYSTNFAVIGQLVLVGIALTLVSSLAAVLFIMRYEPLKILSSGD